MNSNEAIEVIKANWPSSSYKSLIEALELAVKALENKQN